MCERRQGSYSQSDVGKDVFWNGLMQFVVDELVEAIERRVHQFHADPAVSFFEQSTVESHDVW